MARCLKIESEIRTKLVLHSQTPSRVLHPTKPLDALADPVFTEPVPRIRKHFLAKAALD